MFSSSMLSVGASNKKVTSLFMLVDCRVDNYYVGHDLLFEMNRQYIRDVVPIERTLQ